MFVWVKMSDKIKDMWNDYYNRGIIGKESYDLIMCVKGEEDER